MTISLHADPVPLRVDETGTIRVGATREAELEASANPFAKVVLAHLKALQTRGDPESRHAWKLRLVRGLYERGFSAKDVRELFRLIDWLMELPPPLAGMFRQELDNLQEEKRMPYISSFARLSLADGRRDGVESMLRFRFGEEGLKLMPEINQIYDEEQLGAILKALETADKLDDVRRIWAPEAP